MAKLTLFSKNDKFDHKHQEDMRSGQISGQIVKIHMLINYSLVRYSFPGKGKIYEISKDGRAER